MRFEAGNNAQEGGFATAGRADDGDQLANVRQVFDREVDVLKGELGIRAVAEGLGNLLEGHHVRRREQMLLRRGSQHTRGLLWLWLVRSGAFRRMAGSAWVS